MNCERPELEDRIQAVHSITHRWMLQQITDAERVELMRTICPDWEPPKVISHKEEFQPRIYRYSAP